MDPEVEAQVNEQLQQMADLLGQQNAAMASQIKMMNDLAAATEKKRAATEEVTAAEKKATKEVGETSKFTESHSKSLNSVAEANANFSQALKSGKDSLISFAGSMLDVTSGMSKYASSVKGATLAVGAMVSSFGPLGKVTSGLLTVFASLVAASFKYTDNVVKGYDDIAKMGGAIGSSAEGITELARQAGISSQNLEILTKNAASLGINIRAFGPTTSDGVANFGRFIAVGDQQLRQYRKLGFSQEDLTEKMTKYAEQQAISGANLQKSPEALQKSTLKYLDNLVVLGELTGISVDKLQENIDAALANENLNAHINMLRMKQAEILAKGGPGAQAEADKIDAVIAAKEEYAAVALATQSAKEATGLIEAISTDGAVIITKNNAMMNDHNNRLQEQVDNLNKGIPQSQEMLRGRARQIRERQAALGSLVSGAGPASQELRDSFFMSAKSMASAAIYGADTIKSQKSTAELMEQQRAILKKRKEAEEGLMANRSVLDANDRTARLAFDNILKKLSVQFSALVLKVMPVVTQVLTFVSEHFDKVLLSTKILLGAFGTLAAVFAAGKLWSFINSFTSLGDAFSGLFGFKKSGELGSTGNPMYVKMADSVVSSTKGIWNKITGKRAGAGGASSKADEGIDGITKMASKPGADKSGSFLQGLAEGLEMLGKAGGKVLQGSFYLSGAIIAIGAAIGVAGAILGVTLPLLAKGLMSFDKVKGNNLKDVGIGMAGLGAGILAMGGGQVVNAFSGLLTMFKKEDPKNDPIQKLGAKIVEFQKIPINAAKVENNANAFAAFAKAFAAASPNSAMGTITTGITSGIKGLFSNDPPFDKFKEFAKDPIDGKKAKSNILAFIDFANALSTYKAAPGAMDALSQLGGKFVQFVTGDDGPVETFKKFAKDDYGPNMEKNADAFKKYAEAVSSANAASGAPGGASPGGSNFRSAVQAGVQAGGYAGAAVAGAVGGAVVGTGQLVANTVDWAKAKITGKPTDVLNFTAKSGSYENFTALNPNMQKAVVMAATDYKKATGRKMQMNSGRRAVADQERLWAQTEKLGTPGRGPGGMLVGKPPSKGGNPPHLTGNAIDLQEGTSDPSRAKPILAQYGLMQTYGGKDPVHFDLRAMDGGIFDGSETGYPITMHGSELVSPLNMNSVLMKLAKTPATESAKNLAAIASGKTDTSSSKSSDALYSNILKMNSEISNTLDRVIDVLENDHSTQNKILRHSMA